MPTDDPLVWRLDAALADEAALNAHRTRTAATLWATAAAHMARDFIRGASYVFDPTV